MVLPYPAPAKADSLPVRTLAEAFGRGQWHGRARNYFMTTHNQGDLPDYYANGLGAGARFETAPLHGFSVGAGGFFWVNLASNNLATPDAATGAVSRYEVGLFDVSNPARRQLTGRPEELFVRYRWRKSVATFGRQLLVTPLLNPQDGRLSPNYEQGLWLEVDELPRTTITAGWLTHIAVRSTSEWTSVANSIGLYRAGVDETGKRTDYAGNQRTVGHGGHADPRLAYSAPGRQAHALSARLGYQQGPWSLSANYTRITRTGRFLFPREWGREPFYTFLPREREEGFGGLDAAALLASSAVPAVPGLKAEAGYGHYYLPDVRDSRLNKYGMPSYSQFNTSLSYPFRGWAEGLRGQLLYLYKASLGDTYGEVRYVVNKVNMHQLNLILNYDF